MTDPRRFRHFYLAVDTPGPLGGVFMPAVFAPASVDEVWREVRLQDDGTDPIIRDLDALID
jgi:hypothetical protein